jgi:hypothetical protein
MDKDQASPAGPLRRTGDDWRIVVAMIHSADAK